MAKKRGEISEFQKKRKKLNRSKLLILAAVLIVVAYFVFSGIKIIHLNTEKAKVEKKNQELKEELENLNQQLEAINSPEFIERLARKNLKLVKQGELMFILPNLREDNAALESEDGKDGEEEQSSAKDESSEESEKNAANAGEESEKDKADSGEENGEG